MENNDIFKKLVDEVAEEFQKAEEVLKAQELIGEGLNFPAVNQLRYVANHLIAALCEALNQRENSEGQEQIESNLNDALRHCRRSIFDSLEVQAQYYLGWSTDFKESYKDVEIVPVISTYLQDVESIENIREAIPKIERTGINRRQHWQEMQNHLGTLEAIYRKWELSRQELNKKIAAERKQQQHFILTCLLSIAAIIATIVFGRC